jgi:hypothetical protein
MKAIFIFLFALFSLTKSANVYELELNKVYDLDVKKYKEGYIPSGTVNYFKVPVEEDDVVEIVTIELQLKVLRGAKCSFKVFAYEYAEEPTEDEIINRKDKLADYSHLPYEFSNDGILDIYKYSISKGDNVKYISFIVYNGNSIDYLTVQAVGYMEIYFNIFDINYMKELELKNDILEKHKGMFAFRLENDNRNINYIKFKTKKKIETLVGVAGYKDKPNYSIELFDNTFRQELTLNSVTNDEEYYIYEYEYECNYEKMDEIAYLCVFFIYNEKIDYLSVLVGNNSN